MATFIESLMGKLFPERRGALTLKENFQRSDKEEEVQAIWEQSAEAKELMALVYKHYNYRLAGIVDHPEVIVLQSPYANGFAIQCEAPFEAESFRKLFYYLGNNVRKLGYRRQSLDRRYLEKGEEVKMVEKQYFKPSVKALDEGEKISQLYGNISIEKVSYNNEPDHIKCIASVYSDRSYQQAAEFEELVRFIFETP